MSEKRGTKGLELWCKKICEPKVTITNMASWRNGLGFCALIHHFRPDLIDFDKLNKDDIYNNCDLAFTVAEKYLNIPALLDPADMVQFEVPDRLSVLTYLSQFYQVFGAQDASGSKKTPSKSDSQQDDKSPSSSSSKSPLQMAAEIQYSVPKREPCTICNYPVFLAERFKIGRRLYHRTCLKCVHCKQQLTPTDLQDLDETAGFIVGEFTCETCQDRIINESLAPIKADDSIFNDQDDEDADAALFDELVDEQLPTVNVLKRSLSDEEKTQSLKLSNKKMLSAMNDFMSAQYVDEAPAEHANEPDRAQAPAAKAVVSEFAPSGGTTRSGQFDSGVVVVEEVEQASLPQEQASSNSLSPVDKGLSDDDDENTVAPAINEHTFPHAERTETKVEVASAPAQPIVVDDSESEESESETSESSDEEESRGDSPDNNEVSNYTKACTLQLPVAGGHTAKPGIVGREYPVDLNPFGEDEEVEVTVVDRANEAAVKPTPVKRGTNPFGSESEGEEEKVERLKPTPPKVSKSTNPFGSDDDDNDNNVDNVTDQQIVAKRTPIPTPRKSQPTNEPSSFLSLSNVDVSSFGGSTCSLNSNNSSVSTTPRRLKGKAPAPPSSLVSSTPSNLTPSKVNHARPRKARPAPQPPVDQMDSLTLSTASLASTSSTCSVKRLIPLDASLMDGDRSDVRPADSTGETFYRRQITPLSVDEMGQPEKIKDNKDAKNRDRQSGASYHENSYINSDMAISMRRPSADKRLHRKGVAPMAVPPKRVLQMLPLQDIRQELEVIEIQHQGLEKQGVILEKMIREKCECPPADNQAADVQTTDYPNSVDVDDLIMQLFEIVNEKNELFRRQAELMYLRRSHRLEQEQADLEYEIRKSMAQPERNKTDTDKTREENLIARLVEVVQQRNEIIECLEMDRVREREEDTSIQTEKERHAAKRDEEYSKHTLIKLSKKEKKSQKESKKFFLRSSKKVDTEKETDEAEPSKVVKKKKKKFLF